MSKTNTLVLLKLTVLLFCLYVNDMKQTGDCDLFLNTYDSCLVYQHNDVSKFTKNLNKKISNILDWFVDNKLSIHFWEEKTKNILLGKKHKLAKVGSYTYDFCLVYQHKDISKFIQNLSKNVSNICDWFVDNKLSIHFWKKTTKKHAIWQKI